MKRKKFSWERPIETEMLDYLQRKLAMWQELDGKFNGIFERKHAGIVEGNISAFEDVLRMLKAIIYVRSICSKN